MSTSREDLIDIGGTQYLIASDDDYLSWIKSGFELEMVALLRTLVAPGDVVLDVGANIGCTALLFGQLCRQVYAFEPSRTTFAFLEKNIARSGLKNIVAKNAGLGADAANLPLTFHPTNRSGGFISNRIRASKGHATEEVVIRPLDAFVRSLGIAKVDFIKIDVEGFEGQVLRGATQTLATHQPVVMLELNHWCLNAFQRTSIPDFFDFLRSTFPILLAVDGASCKNLHNESESFVVMHYHILHMRFPTIVGAFSESPLGTFRQRYNQPFAF